MPSIRLEAIKPGKLPGSKAYGKAMRKAVEKSAKLVERDYNAFMRTWDHKAKITVIVEENASAYAVFAGTNDKIFGYVDVGTKPHVIKAKRSKYLRWYGGYRAKTRVGIIGSQEGGATGSAQFATEVHHPGFPGRKITIAIQKRRQATIVQEIAQGLAKIGRKA